MYASLKHNKIKGPAFHKTANKIIDNFTATRQFFVNLIFRVPFTLYVEVLSSM